MKSFGGNRSCRCDGIGSFGHRGLLIIAAGNKSEHRYKQNCRQHGRKKSFHIFHLRTEAQHLLFVFLQIRVVRT